VGVSYKDICGKEHPKAQAFPDMIWALAPESQYELQEKRKMSLFKVKRREKKDRSMDLIPRVDILYYNIVIKMNLYIVIKKML